MAKPLVVILEDSAFFKSGQVIKEYEEGEGGILVEDKYVTEGKYIALNETLSSADEKRIKEIIRKQLNILFYNMYTKSSFLVGS